MIALRRRVAARGRAWRARARRPPRRAARPSTCPRNEPGRPKRRSEPGSKRELEIGRPGASSGRQFGSSSSASAPPPGATMSRPRPRFEKSERQPCSVVAPTAEDVRRAGREGEDAVALVAGGADDEHAAAAGEGQRVEQRRDLLRADVGAELEREVDDVGPAADGEADAVGDRRGVALAAGVEHADGHDRRAVGQAGQPDAVVRRLGDRAGDVRAVAVLVVAGSASWLDEVVALDEARLAEVGRLAEAAAVGVGDAAVEHGDGDAAAAGRAGVDRVLPGDGGVDAVARRGSSTGSPASRGRGPGRSGRTRRRGRRGSARRTRRRRRGAGSARTAGRRRRPCGPRARRPRA